MSTYVAVGSVCWDELDGDPRSRLGGSVLFASRVAQAAGWDVRLVTTGTADLEVALRDALPGVDITVQRSATDMVMVFGPEVQLGPQSVRSQPDPVDARGLDATLATADVIHLAPILGEVTHDLALSARRSSRGFVGITPQGLLRYLEPETNRILNRGQLASWWAEAVHAAVVSEHEHAVIADQELLRDVAVAVTRGERGCLGVHGDEVVDVPGIALSNVAPEGTIGAGDVFGAAFFMALASGGDLRSSLEEANRTAAAHVAGVPHRS